MQRGTGRHEQYGDLLTSLLPGQPFNPRSILNKAACNVISSLIYARRFEYGDTHFTNMLNTLEENMGENTGLVPEVGGSGQSAEPHLCCPSSQGKLCVKAVRDAFWESAAGGKTWTLAHLRQQTGRMDQTQGFLKGREPVPPVYVEATQACGFQDRLFLCYPGLQESKGWNRGGDR